MAQGYERKDKQPKIMYLRLIRLRIISYNAKDSFFDFFPSISFSLFFFNLSFMLDFFVLLAFSTFLLLFILLFFLAYIPTFSKVSQSFLFSFLEFNSCHMYFSFSLRHDVINHVLCSNLLGICPPMWKVILDQSFRKKNIMLKKDSNWIIFY